MFSFIILGQLLRVYLTLFNTFIEGENFINFCQSSLCLTEPYKANTYKEKSSQDEDKNSWLLVAELSQEQLEQAKAELYQSQVHLSQLPINYLMQWQQIDLVLLNNSFLWLGVGFTKMRMI